MKPSADTVALPHSGTFRWPARLAFLLALACPALLAAAHPGHASMAEIELNPKSGNLEVALCVWPEALERAIQTGDRPPLRLEAPDELEAEVDRRIVALLARRFVVRDAEGRILKIRWVGKQVDVKRCWLYFEIIGAAESSRLVLENQLFVDQHPDQVNGVTMIGRGPKKSWLFSRDVVRHTIRE